MNIYLLVEDGESFCIKAWTMAQAVNICEKSYLDSCEDQADFNEKIEREYYHENILQSCSLVGPLKN